MKYFKIIKMQLILLICASCSNQIEIIEISSKQKELTTSKNLNVFKNKENIIVKKIDDKVIEEELGKIKKATTREDFMPSTVLHYAFVSKKDTIFATGNLKYWYYKGKVQMYSSKIVNTETIEGLMSNVPN